MTCQMCGERGKTWSGDEQLSTARRELAALRAEYTRLRATFELAEQKRASECDVLNTELRENYGAQYQVEAESDWRNAIKKLVICVRRADEFLHREEIIALRAENARLIVALKRIDFNLGYDNDIVRTILESAQGESK